MVVGAGGQSAKSITGSDPRVLATAQAYGALRMEVYPERIDYSYRSPDGAKGKTLDTGFVRCTALPRDTSSPSAPTGLSASLRNTGTATYSADLTWSSADDDRGVAQYRVRRGDAVLATLPASASGWTAPNLAASTTYTFTVTALDAWERVSALHPGVPGHPGRHTCHRSRHRQRRHYTTELQPNKNYGRATALRLDSDPSVKTYLRFTVSGSYPDVTSAHLRVWRRPRARRASRPDPCRRRGGRRRSRPRRHRRPARSSPPPERSRRGHGWTSR